jgi:hypothetical protein
MAKAEKHVTPEAKPEPVAAPVPTPCAVCGQNAGEFITVVGHIRAHAECAARRPDVIAKAKARA